MASKKKARKTKPASNLLKVKEAKTTAANDKAPIPETKAKEHVTIAKAKGRPMLSWVGKRPLNAVTAFPAQHIESFAAPDADKIPVADMAIWKDWPEKYPRGGLLFHGDNKEVLAHLLANGFRGKVDLIYIDPPFDSGADYARKVTIRGAKGTAEIDGEGYTLGEQIQYTDIWANDNYLQFMYERLLLLRELLAPNGSIWLHCDWHKSHHLRSLMDEVFGPDSLRNEVIWQRTDPHNDAISRLGWVHDTLYWYGKGEETIYNWKAVVEPLSEAALREYSLIKLQDGTVVPYSQELEGKGRRFKLDDCTYKGTDPTRRFEWRGAKPSDKRVWPHNPEGMDAAVARGEFFLRDPNRGTARCRVSFLDERPGQVLQTIWTECGRMKGGVEYPTEKPQALLARIIQASSNFGGLVLDCFVGSGTTVAAAQLLGRRWIACDINKGAIQAVNK
ncbi:site-specific DNA-methyltransferase, partial [bacterium]